MAEVKLPDISGGAMPMQMRGNSQGSANRGIVR